MRIKPVDNLYFGAHLPNKQNENKQKERKQKEMKLTSEYTTEEITKMKEELWEAEFDLFDLGDLKQILWDGCIGWEAMEDDTVISHYMEHYGDLED